MKPAQHTFFSLLLVSQACTAITVRPTYRPFPLAAFDTVTAKPPSVITGASADLVRLGLTVRTITAAEGYLETRWFDLGEKRSRREVANPDRTVRIRVWADLVTPLQSEVIVEAVHQRLLDPSVPERENEVVAVAGSPGDSIAQALRTAIKARFGGGKAAGGKT
ncbi:MAG: hypothetical protein EXR93_09255 [Gemmatimonadetes bacterium]|nr:hypothetical protein [Gemmatimonadota bacterium]